MCVVCPLRACLTVGRCRHHAPRHLHKLHYRKYRAAKQEAEQMSTAQIDHILKANEYSHSFSRGPASHGAQGFHSNLLSANQPCEDSRSSASCLVDRSAGGGALMFGVFDGHAGAACAQAVSHRLFYYIAVATLPLQTLQEIESAVEEARTVPPLLEFHQQPREEQRCGAQQPLMFSSRLRMFWEDLLQEAQEDTTALLDTEGSNVSSALEEAFMRLDNDLSMEAQLDLATSSPRRVPGPGDSHSLSSPLRVALSGSTACVAHLSQGVLHVANVGDSRALLGVQESDGSWSALPLTQDHTAHNPDELYRVLGEHPRSERRTVIRHDRLLGMLMPLRAFGDVRFKWSKETLSRMYESSRPEVVAAAMSVARRGTMTHYQHYHTPPYLTANPEVATHRLRPQDKFLIMATDGLWDLMHRHTAVQLVGEHLTGLHWQRPLSPNSGTTLGSMQRLLLERKGRSMSTSEDVNSATHLLRHALGNDGYGGVEPRRLAKMLRLSPDLARMYRDDITVTVVHLNEPDIVYSYRLRPE